jgi:hypothetical protein
VDLTAFRVDTEISAAPHIALLPIACQDFGRFKPLFEQAESDLQAGICRSRPFGKDASIAPGDFFILGGQTVYVA